MERSARRFAKAPPRGRASKGRFRELEAAEAQWGQSSCRQGGLTPEGLTKPWSGRRGDSAEIAPAEEGAPLMCTRMVRTCCWSAKRAAELGVAEGV